MATKTEKLPNGPLHAGSLFRSRPGFSSPMHQLTISPQFNLNSTSDLPPSPIDGPNQPDAIMAEACALARDYVTHAVYGSSTSASKTAETLRRVGDEVMVRHKTVMNAMAKRLLFSELAVQEQYSGLSLNQMKFTYLADEIAKDKQENWGRIVTLFVLGSILSQNDVQEQNGRDIDEIIETIGNYIGTRKRAWIEKNGGWDGFIKFFDKGSSVTESKVWKGLLCAGLGLGAIVVAAKH